jgi:hypothetical protein
VRHELGSAAIDLENPAWRQANAQRLTACWSAFDGYATEKFAGKSIGDFVSKEAYLNGMGPAADREGAQMNLSGIACQMLAGAFAGQFEGSGAVNFLEVNLAHETVGPMSVTIQRVQGKTPGQLRAETERELAETKIKLARSQARVAELERASAGEEHF